MFWSLINRGLMAIYSTKQLISGRDLFHINDVITAVRMSRYPVIGIRYSVLNTEYRLLIT